MLREITCENRLPDYVLSEEPGDILRVTPRAAVLEPGEGPHLCSETLDEARGLVPGADVHALQVEWRSWWGATGRPRLRSAVRALLGWVRTRSN